MAAFGRSAVQGGEMTHRSIGRIAAAVALTAILALAAPAQAAGWTPGIPTSGWLEAALQWMAGVWPGGREGTASGSKAEKTIGTDSSSATVTTPPPTTNADKGFGIDPNG
jgi:hypothetical protein